MSNIIDDINKPIVETSIHNGFYIPPTSKTLTITASSQRLLFMSFIRLSQ